VVTLDSSNPVSQYTLSDTSHDGNGAGRLSPDLWDETLSGTPSANLTEKVKVNKGSALLDSFGDNIGAEFTPILKSKVIVLKMSINDCCAQNNSQKL